MEHLTGQIIQIVGPVIDVSFELNGQELPHILDALEITRDQRSG